MFEIFSKIQKHKDKFWRRNTIFCFTFSQFRQKPHSKAHWGGGFFCFSKTKKHCFPSPLVTKSIKIFRLRRACFFFQKKSQKTFLKDYKKYNSYPRIWDFPPDSRMDILQNEKIYNTTLILQFADRAACGGREGDFIGPELERFPCQRLTAAYIFLPFFEGNIIGRQVLLPPK